MSKNLIDRTQKILGAGFSVVPVGANKKPPMEWGPFQKAIPKISEIERYMDKNIALIAGKVSGNLECIDVDCKYDLTGTLMEDYGALIRDNSESLVDKLVVQKTQNDGYHLLYRCSEIGKNQKLAERPATKEEGATGEKIKVLIETRGEGGYFLIDPSDGYKFLSEKTVDDIQEITPEEREMLFTAARSFDQNLKEYRPKTKQRESFNDGKSIFAQYDSDADVVQLLEKHGWKWLKEDRKNAYMRRPGKITNESSACYHLENKWFTVFSTSTEFDTHKAHKPSHVFCILECGEDWKLCAEKLRDMGYSGEATFESEKKSITSKGFVDNDDMSFIDENTDEYLQQARSGTLPMGITTGVSALDKWFLLKHGNFVIVNGHDNVGKSTVMWYLMVLSAVNHGWKWPVLVAENKTGFAKRRFMEFKAGIPITDMVPEKYNETKAFVDKHFKFIKNDNVYTYQELLLLSEKLMKNWPFQGMLWDPYNGIGVDFKLLKQLGNHHEYHYHATNEIKLFCKRYDACLYLNCHAVTEALRRTDKDGYPVAPNKADTEGGGKMANRADDFITIHRKTQHPTDWMFTEFHVRKIKELETGGRPTPLDFPILLRMWANKCGFEVTADQPQMFDPTEPSKNTQANDDMSNL